MVFWGAHQTRGIVESSALGADATRKDNARWPWRKSQKSHGEWDGPQCNPQKKCLPQILGLNGGEF